MDVRFKDKKLALIETDQATETRFPVSVINSARQKLVIVRSAPDERTLRNWKSLHFEKLKGNYAGLFSIRLNIQWRLVFELETDCAPPRLTVIAIEDYH